MKENRIKITKERVDKISFPVIGQTIYRDTTLPGFCLRVGSERKAYFVQKKRGGRKIVYTLGMHGHITADEARDLAIQRLSDITKGINPVEAKKEAKARAVTLQQALAEYLTARNNLKPRTRTDYIEVVNYMPDWHGKTLSAISKDMIEKRHRLLTEKRGKARANYAMRVLRAVFNFALDRYEVQGKPVLYENPVRRLSQARAWHKIKSRTDYIKADELPKFFAALEKMICPECEYSWEPRKPEPKTCPRCKEQVEIMPPSETMRDYFTLILFTGLRRLEAAKLRWENVNFTAKTITITDTKNNDPLELPMSNFLHDLFKRRKETAGENEWVFQGDGEIGHLIEPKRQLDNIRKSSGLTFTIHGLRRTFATIAESLDLSAYAIKRLVNHRQTEQDITGRYVMKDVERLREPVQRIADYILAKAGKTEMSNVIAITKAREAKG
jgi:integrase